MRFRMANPVFKTTGNGPTGPNHVPSGTKGYAAEYKAGEHIFREGGLGTEMYIINEGKVEILNVVGDEEQVLAVLEKGDFFGEMSVLEDLPRAATARAATDVRLLQINGSTFDQLLQGNPEIAVRMMRKLSRRLRETDEMIKSLLGTKITSREMPRPDIQVPAEGPERLGHPPPGMEFHPPPGRHGFPPLERLGDHHRPQGPGDRHLPRHRPHPGGQPALGEPPPRQDLPPRQQVLLRRGDRHHERHLPQRPPPG